MYSKMLFVIIAVIAPNVIASSLNGEQSVNPEGAEEPIRVDVEGIAQRRQREKEFPGIIHTFDYTLNNQAQQCYNAFQQNDGQLIKKSNLIKKLSEMVELLLKLLDEINILLSHINGETVEWMRKIKDSDRLSDDEKRQLNSIIDKLNKVVQMFMKWHFDVEIESTQSSEVKLKMFEREKGDQAEYILTHAPKMVFITGSNYDRLKKLAENVIKLIKHLMTKKFNQNLEKLKNDLNPYLDLSQKVKISLNVLHNRVSLTAAYSTLNSNDKKKWFSDITEPLDRLLALLEKDDCVKVMAERIKPFIPSANDQMIAINSEYRQLWDEIEQAMELNEVQEAFDKATGKENIDVKNKADVKVEKMKEKDEKNKNDDKNDKKKNKKSTKEKRSSGICSCFRGK